MSPDALGRRPGAAVSLDRVAKRFGTAPAVHEVSLRLAAGSFTALLGPSGCGKTTTLAMLAGLIAPDAGDILLDDASALGVPAERRPVSLVFQRPLLFPYLTVRQNVAFGLRMRRLPRREVRSTVGAMLERVQLGALAGRRVGELSGGQEQRVALARALVLEPRVLLLDEPFSQLDPELRADMRALVRELVAEAKVTTLFVTHDQAEAVEVADEIALMLDGRIAGCGSAELFYLRPPTLAAARFFGATNELPGRITAGRFVPDHAWFAVPADGPDGAAVLVVRPERLRLGTGPGGPGLAVEGMLVSARFAGSALAVGVRLPGGRLLSAHLPVGTPVELGACVQVTFPAEAGTILPVPPD